MHDVARQLGVVSVLASALGPIRRANSRRDRYRCRDWNETASMIRFNLMWPHTINRPASRGRTNSHAVARCQPSLPIQHDGGFGTSWTSEANIKKCLRREIGT
jgi:hypothetical protein